jgi:gamma-aminobutyric acid type B receptor
MAIGIAACETPNDNFTGLELYNTLLATEFDGATGHVAFSKSTGTRMLDTVSYRVVNVLADWPTPNSNVTFALGVDAAYVNLGDQTVDVVQPFRFADGTTKAPAPSHVSGEELNLISKGVLYFTVSVAALVMMLSIGCAWWTIRYRKKRVVRRSQPIFLCMLCVGTFLMASTVGFQGFQEPLSEGALDFACMFSPWLISIGFTTTFAALFSKTWRINHVYRKAQKLKRVTVRVQDVLWPFAVLFVASVAVLTAWTITDPLKWERVTISEDSYGQPTASYGTCYALQGKDRAFLIASISLCVVALVIANYQSFLARNLPSDYNEAFFVAITNAILLESAIVSAPILAIVHEEPESFFLVRSLLLIVASLSVLLPIFVPKMLHKEGMKRRRGVYLRALSFDTLSSISAC